MLSLPAKDLTISSISSLVTILILSSAAYAFHPTGKKWKEHTSYTPAPALADTAITDPSAVDWETVQSLTAKGGNLLATLKNGDTVLMARDAYTNYAQKNNKVRGEQLFEQMEVEPEYPGGDKAWLKFLMMNLQYPQQALPNGTVGNVVVQFTVDEKGRVKDVKPLTSFGNGLEKEAVRVVKASGRWHPGIQNFYLVKGSKKVSILFRQ